MTGPTFRSRSRRLRSALTGTGHGTDRAILLGLSGETPEHVDPAQVDLIVSRIRSQKELLLLGVRPVPFEPDQDLLFHRNQVLPGHPNGMRFSAFDRQDNPIVSEVYYSIGGGFIFKEGEPAPDRAAPLPVPHPSTDGAELLARAGSKRLPIWRLMLENESALRSEAEVRDRLFQIWSVMDACIERGLHTEGILPGGLNVRRRSIGILYKENASISGAEVGCQGEAGVACSMAAAGLTGARGGTNYEVEHAAEIGMEHHLGMTCDPIGGLVQIPCIERNAIGAVKAINACSMAMQEAGEHKVSLDQVIRTMYQTGLDMQSRYKETALAGLAVNVKNC